MKRIKRKMTTEELNDIIEELLSAPEVFRQSIKCYNAMSNDNPNKKELGRAISHAKKTLRELDVTLEDISWSIERDEVIKLMDNLK